MTTRDEAAEPSADRPNAEVVGVAEDATAPDETVVTADGIPSAERPTQRPRRSWSWVLAMLPGLLALAWLAWNSQQPVVPPVPATDHEEPIELLRTQLAGQHEQWTAAQSMIAALEQRLDAYDVQGLERELDRYRNELAETGRRLENRLHDIDQRLEQAALDRPDTESRLPLLEAAALLRLGADRFELMQDVEGARQAFTRARQRLSLSDDPRVVTVDRRIASEIEVMGRWQRPDWAGIQGRLQVLAGQVQDWPAVAAESLLQDAPEPRRSLRSRAHRVLAGLVSIRRADAPHLSPAESDRLRFAIRARLAAAELAAARRDADELAGLLQPVDEALVQFFAADDDAVQAARQMLAELVAASVGEPPPAVGEASRQLQALLDRASARGSQ